MNIPSKTDNSKQFTTIMSCMAAVITLSAFLQVFYFLGSQVLGSGWLAALGVNSVLCLFVLRFWHQKKNPRIEELFGVKLGTSTSKQRAYIPSFIIIFGSIFLALVSQMIVHQPSEFSFRPEFLIFITIIPLVEECLFRRGIGVYLRDRFGFLVGTYFSALVFAVAHVQLFQSFASESAIGVPLGPFLLGLACESIYAASGRFFAIVCLHAACNATPIIFSAIDPRWLDWLGVFYL